MDPKTGDLERIEALDIQDTDDGSEEIAVTRVEIEQTRVELGDTLDAIKEKLNPQILMEQAKDTVREATIGRAQDAVGQAVDNVKETVAGAADSAKAAMSNAGEATRGTGTMIIETIKENPMPAAITGLGLAWLWMSARQHHAAPSYPRRYTEQYGYTERPTAQLYGQNWDRTGYQEQGLYPEPGPIDQAKASASRMAGQVQDQASDLGRRVQDKVGEVSDRVQDQASQIGGQVQDTMSDLGSRAQYQARHASDQFGRMLQESPLAAGAIAMALGAGLALAMPMTPQENRLMGDARDQLVDKAQDAVEGVAQSAQNAVQDAVHDAVDTVKEQTARNLGLNG